MQDTKPTKKPWRGMSALRYYSLGSQQDIWVDADGNTHKLSNMSTRYLRNLRRFLERHTAAHAVSAIWNYPFLFGDQDVPDDVERDMLRDMDRMMEWAQDIKTMPLYRGILLELRHRRRLARTYNVRHLADIIERGERDG